MKKLFITLLLIIPCLSLTGCLRSKYPNRTQYMFDVKLPAKKTNSSTTVLQLYNTSIVPQFSGTSFVYRTSNINYLKDHYNVFFIPPTRQINHILINYLYKAGLFHYITNTNLLGKSNYILHSKILALYADYRDRQHPKAIIKIRFVLFKPQNHKLHIIMNKSFSQAIPLSEKSSRTLVKSWNMGLQKILKRLTIDLYGIISD